MRPIKKAMERNYCLTFGKPARVANWVAVTFVLLSATFMLDCGSSATPSQGNTPPAVTVSVNPLTAQVALLGQTQFTATVNGSSEGVSWSVNGSAGGNITVGVISNSGLYTAPTDLPSPNTVTVTAVSLANSAQSASATVTIVNPQPSVLGHITIFSPCPMDT